MGLCWAPCIRCSVLVGWFLLGPFGNCTSILISRKLWSCMSMSCMVIVPGDCEGWCVGGALLWASVVVGPVWAPVWAFCRGSLLGSVWRFVWAFCRTLLVLYCLVLSCLVLSCSVLSCLVLSCLVLSCLVLSCLVLSCLVLSCLVLWCLRFETWAWLGDPGLYSHWPPSTTPLASISWSVVVCRQVPLAPWQVLAVLQVLVARTCRCAGTCTRTRASTCAPRTHVAARRSSLDLLVLTSWPCPLGPAFVLSNSRSWRHCCHFAVCTGCA